MSRCSWLIVGLCSLFLCGAPLAAADKPATKKAPPKKPVKAPFIAPSLPGGQEVATIESADLLKKPESLLDGVKVAKTAPRVEFRFFPGQTYEGDPWSIWGDSSFSNGKYYSAIGDHAAPRGNAFVFEYDPATKTLRKILDIQQTLKMPEGHYVPGKIHSRSELAADGWLYCSTHRGSPRVTTDQYHYEGDWILRCNPATGAMESVVHAPVKKHAIPNGMIDPQRLIFYGGTAPSITLEKTEGIQFFAYDLKNKKLLYSGPNGPARAMILSSSTGRVYFTPVHQDSPLMRYDPASGQPPQEIPGQIGIRATTNETPQGIVYSVSQGNPMNPSTIFAFDCKTEKVSVLGPSSVASNHYIATIKADPSGRYLYYIPGAHGGAERDNTPVVQYDTQTKQRKVIAFLAPAFQQQVNCVPSGTYGLALDDKGETMFVTWNVNRGTKVWDCCGLTVIHIPASERPL